MFQTYHFANQRIQNVDLFGKCVYEAFFKLWNYLFKLLEFEDFLYFEMLKMKCWNFGLLEIWNFETLQFWDFGTLEFLNVGNKTFELLEKTGLQNRWRFVYLFGNLECGIKSFQKTWNGWLVIWDHWIFETLLPRNQKTKSLFIFNGGILIFDNT